MLEDEPDLTIPGLPPRRIFSVEKNLALVGSLQAGDDPQEAGLSRAGRSEEGHQLPFGNREVHSMKGGKRTEPFDDVVDFDLHRISRSTTLLATRVTKASNVRREATANAAAKWYSL